MGLDVYDRRRQRTIAMEVLCFLWDVVFALLFARGARRGLVGGAPHHDVAPEPSGSDRMALRMRPTWLVRVRFDSLGVLVSEPLPLCPLDGSLLPFY